MPYWIYKNGKTVGPLDSQEVQYRATPESLVSNGGEWVRFDEHPDFGPTSHVDGKVGAAAGPRSSIANRLVIGVLVIAVVSLLCIVLLMAVIDRGSPNSLVPKETQDSSEGVSDRPRLERATSDKEEGTSATIDARNVNQPLADAMKHYGEAISEFGNVLGEAKADLSLLYSDAWKDKYADSATRLLAAGEKLRSECSDRTGTAFRVTEEAISHYDNAALLARQFIKSLNGSDLSMLALEMNLGNEKTQEAASLLRQALAFSQPENQEQPVSGEWQLAVDIMGDPWVHVRNTSHCDWDEVIFSVNGIWFLRPKVLSGFADQRPEVPSGESTTFYIWGSHSMLWANDQAGRKFPPGTVPEVLGATGTCDGSPFSILLDENSQLEQEIREELRRPHTRAEPGSVAPLDSTRGVAAPSAVPPTENANESSETKQTATQERLGGTREVAAAGVELRGTPHGQGTQPSGTDRQGNTYIPAGKSARQQIPSWVPVYSNGRFQNPSYMGMGDALIGGFEVVTSDSVDAVVAFYRASLKNAGFAIEGDSPSSGEGGTRRINAQNRATDRKVEITLREEGGETIVTVSYSQGR